ncbi:MAG: hypothetical protein OEW39_09225, partial [Deltaproteobacteria bacterium]|nr:hypothetical protein [Deltaproteobacteria bacterium]
MLEPLKKLVSIHWSQKKSRLLALAEDSTRQVHNFLALEEYYRGARKGEALEKSFGGFATGALDLKALSSTLKRSYDNRTMEKARYERLQALEASLSAHAEGFRKRPPEPAFATLDQGA